MPSKRVLKELNSGAYFLTFTVHQWYYLFDRHDRWEILVDSLEYCQKHKDLLVHHYVLMLNHLHLIISSPDVSGFIRDFKRYTSKAVHENLETYEPRVLELFLDKEGGYSFWQQTSMPLWLQTVPFYLQKAQYIEYNPVRKNYVIRPEHWYYSSAHRESPVRISRLM